MSVKSEFHITSSPGCGGNMDWMQLVQHLPPSRGGSLSHSCHQTGQREQEVALLVFWLREGSMPGDSAGSNWFWEKALIDFFFLWQSRVLFFWKCVKQFALYRNKAVYCARPTHHTDNPKGYLYLTNINGLVPYPILGCHHYLISVTVTE